MNEYSLIRLFPSSSEEIISHFLDMSINDRYLRFGYSASDENIKNYIRASLEAPRSTWYGIKIGDCLVATIHISMVENIAEFAFTTCEHHRGKKLGQLLFARGYQMVTEHQIDRIYLCMLSKNKAMIRIAKKFGMNVMIHGVESEASITIECPVPLSKFKEVKYTLIDSSLFK